MTGDRKPRRLVVDSQPVWVTEPVTPATGSVVILHAVGENRTGNNYLLRALAEGCARAGLAAVRFDLPGSGESVLGADLRSTDALVRAVSAAAAELVPGAPVHWVGRSLSAGLLPRSEGSGGLRVALCPPDPTAVLEALDGAPDILAPVEPLGPEQARFWTGAGAEPNLVGGLTVPSDLLRALGRRLADQPWDFAIAPAGTPPAIVGPSVLVCGADPLLRSEFDRAAVSVLLPRLLKEGTRWLRAPC